MHHMASLLYYCELPLPTLFYSVKCRKIDTVFSTEFYHDAFVFIISKRRLGNQRHAQQFNVLQFRTSGETGYGYLWQDNRWQSSLYGAKGHDFNHWSPMSFDQDGNVKYMNYTANFTIDVLSNIH